MLSVGIIMLLSPFIVLFCVISLKDGVLEALFIFAITLFIASWTMTGSYFLVEALK